MSNNVTGNAERRFVIAPHKKNEYETTIDYWLDCATEFDDDINFKELSKLSKKKLFKRLSIPKTDDGRIVIMPYNIHTDLYEYYDNPKKYYSDLYRYIKTLRLVIHNERNSKSVSFTYPDEPDVHEMSLIHFVFNMIAWMPCFILGLHINKDMTFMPRDFNNKEYTKFLNTKIIEPYKDRVTFTELSAILCRMYDMFIIISERYSLDLGLSFSLHDIISKWDNKEIYDINHTKGNKNMQISETEDYFNAQLNRYKEIMKNDPNDNVLKPMLRSGEGCNNKQLREFAINIGYKPDTNGFTVPFVPTTNFITDGLRDPVSSTIDALANRKANILALEIDNSGYLARTFSKCASNIYLNPDPNYICDTKTYYVRTINNAFDLKDMRGRWYLTNKGTLRQLIDSDYDMIGKTLKFRSPVTCASKNGICACCYGHLYNQNKYINIGINSTLLVSEKSYQMTMSAKHVLDTTTQNLSFPEEFYDYFTVDQGFLIKVRYDIEMIENFILKINVMDIHRYNDIQDLADNEYICSFKLHNIEDNTDTEFSDSEQKFLNLSDQLLSIVSAKRKKADYDEDGWISIPLTDIDPDEDLMYVKLKNAEITRNIKSIKSMIEKGKEIEGVETISELLTKLNNMFKSGGVICEGVHVEVLARNLIRDRDNITQVPDYSKENPNYVLTSVHNSILNSSSVVTSLTFERLHQQLGNPLTYEKRGTSALDRLFIE